MGKFSLKETGFEGLFEITPKVFEDGRGYFMETYNKKDFENMGIKNEFIQENQSKSKKGTLRGMHFQLENTQAKLVKCIQGAVYDVVVDLRAKSMTYGKWYGTFLTDKNKRMLMIPKGFAHGFLVMTNEAEFSYMCDDVYNSEAECGIKWDDSLIGIKWPNLEEMNLVISEKDKKWESIFELEKNGTISHL